MPDTVPKETAGAAATAAADFPALDKEEHEALLAESNTISSKYNFELPRIVSEARRTRARLVALQFPEGLAPYGPSIAEVLGKHGVDSVVLADIIYGACCIDDLACQALGAELLVHFGHSRLVSSLVDTIYIPVHVFMSPGVLDSALDEAFRTPCSIALFSTAQFTCLLPAIEEHLASKGFRVTVKAVSPLEPGEILGCTAPCLDGVDSALVICDGRFHVEAVGLANPGVALYRYDPYTGVLSREMYDSNTVLSTRKRLAESLDNAHTVGVILGVLGRQGGIRATDELRKRLVGVGKRVMMIHIADITSSLLDMFPDVDVWVEVACPRLAIDWGTSYHKPLLTAFECARWLGAEGERYRLDNFARNKGSSCSSCAECECGTE